MGIARVIDQRDVSESVMRKALDDILDNLSSYRKRVSRLKHLAKTMNGAVTLADEVERTVARGGRDDK